MYWTVLLIVSLMVCTVPAYLSQCTLMRAKPESRFMPLHLMVCLPFLIIPLMLFSFVAYASPVETLLTGIILMIPVILGYVLALCLRLKTPWENNTLFLVAGLVGSILISALVIGSFEDPYRSMISSKSLFSSEVAGLMQFYFYFVVPGVPAYLLEALICSRADGKLARGMLPAVLLLAMVVGVPYMLLAESTWDFANAGMLLMRLVAPLNCMILAWITYRYSGKSTAEQKEQGLLPEEGILPEAGTSTAPLPQ